jgi:hypothetical protein
MEVFAAVSMKAKAIVKQIFTTGLRISNDEY